MTAAVASHNGNDAPAKITRIVNDSAREPYILKGEHTRRIVKMIDALHAANITPMLWGLPGVGKTALIHALSKREGFGGAFVVLTGSQDKSDTLGMPSRSSYVAKTGEEFTATEHATPRWALEANDAEGTVYVFLDELPQAEVDVQGTFLTVLQGRVMPSGFKLADHVKFIAAGNPTDVVASGYELIEPLQNRLAHMTYEPPRDEWFQGMMDAWGDEDAPDAEMTLRSYIVAYLKGNGNLLHNPPEMGAENANAWPSRRSWDNLARAGAVLFDDKDSLEFLAESLIGKSAATGFVTTMFHLKSKTPDEIIADPSCVDWSNSLQGFVALSSVVSWITKPEDVPLVIKVFNTAVKMGPRDVAAQHLERLAVTNRKIGGKATVFRELDKSESGFLPFMKLLYGGKGKSSEDGDS